MSGASGRTQGGPRRGLRLGAALLFAAVTGLWMSSASGPPRPLVALFDGEWRTDQPFGETQVLEVRVPHTVGVEQRAALEASLAIATSRVAELMVRRDADATLIWLALKPDTPAERLEAIVSSGAGSLSFLPILDEGSTANAIRAFAEANPELGLRVDSVDPVSADSEEALFAGLEAMRDSCASCRPRLGESLVIERDDERWSAKVVTYRDPVFDGRYLTGADVATSAFDGKPRVNLYLTDDGRRAFRELSRELIGTRLAIVMDGRVVSSPRVLAEIDTDSVEVSVPTGNSEEMLAEATRIASALTPRVGLPTEATWRWFTLPAASGVAMALGYGLALLLSALLGWFAARGVERYERWAGIVAASAAPTITQTGRPSAGLIAMRTLASLVALAMPSLVSRIPIPVLDHEVLAGLGDGARAFSSIGAGGTTQLVLGFLIVAAIPWLIPALERLRTGSFDARRRLLLPTGLIVFALCALQAVALTPLYLSAELLEPGLLSVILLALSLAAGTFLLWGAASFATLAGFGHGFSLITLGVILDAVAATPLKLADGRAVAVILLIGAVACYATSRALSPRGAAYRPHRLPLAGVAPVELLGVIQSILLIASLLFAVDLRTPQLGPWLSFAVFLGLTAGISWLYTRPIGRRELLMGLFPSALVVVLFVQGAVVISELGPAAAPMKLAELLLLVYVPAILLDLAQEVRVTVRHGRLSRVASTHSPDEADRLTELLMAREIPAMSRGIRHRTLLRFLGPWLPIEVLVPLGERRAALAFLREDELGQLAAPFGEEEGTPAEAHDAEEPEAA